MPMGARRRRPGATMTSEQARPSPEELERRLVEEIDRTIRYLEGAVQEAPDDEALRERLRAILDQTRSFRDKVTEVMERARRRRAGEE